MRLICAWCKKSISKEDEEDKEVSHGICKKCRVVYFGEFEKIKEASDMIASNNL